MKLALRLVIAFVLLSAVSNAQDAAQGYLDTFVGQTGAIPTIDQATSSISFLRFPAGRALKLTGGTPQEKALNFINQNTGLLAIQSKSEAYQVKESRKDIYGMEHVVLQQYVNGVPVFDGVLKFHFNKIDDLSSMNGNRVKAGKLNTTPTISKEVAADLAIKMVELQKSDGGGSKLNPPLQAPLKVNKNTLYVFQKGLAQGYEGQKHLVYEVEVRNDVDVREFLYIDAHTKELVEQFSGMHEALNRKLYSYPTGSTTNTIPALTWEEGNVFPGALNVWQKSELETAGHLYNFMKNAFGYISYNNADAPMLTTHNNPGIQCPNANWNGVSANYCDRTASDDVVAHEWAHAYTEFTSGLIYAWQAGAMNEAYSDIWGETVDLLNGYMDEDEGIALRATAGNDCPATTTSTRWRLSEKASAFAPGGVGDGAIRDMYNPNCLGDPGRVTDIKYYCASGVPTNNNDAGGVHINSGVLNHSYALLVDGGTYNGQTISGIGLTKAAHIYWYAQANFMTQTTDFAAQADILVAAAEALIAANTNLPNLSTADAAPTLSGQYVTAADLAELQKVILAVELRAATNCGYAPILNPVATICDGGTAENALYFYDFENGLENWTVANTGVAGWSPRDWVLVDGSSVGHPGKVVYAVNYNGTDCNNGKEQGLMSLTSPVMTIGSVNSGQFNLAFDHYISLEQGYDGGNIKYKINDGAWTLVPSSAFLTNGYNGTISSGNPLAGQVAFTGFDTGTVLGVWGQSRINLTALGLDAGEQIQFRWDLGTDLCGGVDGWYIDNVRVYSCETPLVPTVLFAKSSTTVNEAEALTDGLSPAGCLPYLEKTVTVKVTKAPSEPVTVTFNAPTGTAKSGTTADYSFSPNSFVLQAGTLSQDVVVRIYNDAYKEETETAILTYSITTSGNAVTDDKNQVHTIYINDDELLPGTKSTQVLYADFNDFRIPAGWSGTNFYPLEWAVVAGSNPTTIFLDPNIPGQPFLIASSTRYGPGERTWNIETATFNTAGMKSINLSFLEVFRIFAGGSDFDEIGTVDVWDGAAWHNLLTETETTGNSGSYGAAVTRNIVIPDQYASVAMKLRFRYTANNDYYWGLDNIKVTAEIPTQIETLVTATPDEQYLGPNATAYFYDPVTKNLLAKIENLTAHDYGCTTVQIDRAGTGAEDWVGAYTITKKTYKVTPANPNPIGEYNITLYYKDSELGGYKSSIQSMGKSEAGITIDNSNSGSYAQVQVMSAFNSDWAFKSKFTSGFSGFGLSNAPPVGSLPVTLVKFDGKNSLEGNILNWATTAELNSDYFAVERATDVKNFVEIGRVASNGTSAITNNYNFTDTKYVKGMNYYRLKLVDTDDSHAYSKIVGIDAANLREVKFYPNPVQAMVNIELPDAEMNQVSVKIINASGQVVVEKGKVKTTRGIVTQDMSKLGTGIYQVVISNEKTSYNFSILKL
ncbi:M4 family metallopeptidase [Dyadobacter psychrotolerans]|uniref:T9SS type A sorting domain-containing protein n=1 Tax=Dyadobacter psychrotolerans TaxID=2541721 RepID=A0A4R5DI67_9BACT|nr:M4 family metallopeptidase [Dyadobacter psychrotolerans]TDE11640.1 T9SS type A sorting domain-containing protein [Dyadobacter psychrotolerans]